MKPITSDFLRKSFGSNVLYSFCVKHKTQHKNKLAGQVYAQNISIVSLPCMLKLNVVVVGHTLKTRSKTLFLYDLLFDFVTKC